MKPGTRAVHAGTGPAAPRSLTPPLYQSSVYYADSLAEAVALEDPTALVSSYSRTANPTIAHFESALAELEGGEAAVATPSGMAALTLTCLTLLGPGDRVAVSPHSYADTLTLVAELAQRIGFAVLVTDLSTVDGVAELERFGPTFVIVETPSNPMLRLVDLAELAGRLAGTGATLVVDSTLGTPVNQRPLRLGADLVIHSASKYLTGHHNAIAGVVVGAAPLVERLRGMRTITGICPDPHSAWLLLQGMQTLALRVAAQNATAQAVAEFLAGQPAVDFVAYPGLGPDPVAARQMSGYGGVLTFGLRAGREALAPFLESLRLCTIAVSLGGTKTLIEAPSLMSHVQGGPENESLRVIPDNAIRLSVGLEAAEDIIADLLWGLDAVHPRAQPAAADAVADRDQPEAADGPSVATLLAEVLGLARVPETARLREELGMDSLTGTYLIAQLLLRHGIRVPLTTVFETATVAELSAAVDALRGAAR